jgi:quercetin dioxygenase-like cupin family protein
MRAMNVPFLGVLVLLTAVAPDGPVPVEEEPNHKTIFKNAYVQAFRVTLDPGKATLVHVHAKDDVQVRLSTATIQSESPGQPAKSPESTAPGVVSARDNEAKPLTHRVKNVGSTVFDVLDVQAMARPEGPEAPAIAKPDAENARMRVYRYALGPGEATPQHAHARPYLVVAATEVKLKMTAPDGRSMEHPVKAGDLRWVDAAVTHTLVNAGDEKAVLVEIELK